ncbi:hypothetical protein [Reichenbachiella agariperforans]|uniref:hypothetical protein n=1 Tax=Reichenbachiella agariperforans TaxID=156994 RepID=UPI001C08FA6D|nr:hypothetical protein [Reichenbachiella agariperforans]MBU2913440.1 hypothetical protein [Reichenbachiella agariperforans]
MDVIIHGSELLSSTFSFSVNVYAAVDDADTSVFFGLAMTPLSRNQQSMLVNWSHG